MIENERRKNHKDLETVQEGFANGVATGFPLTESEKNHMIIEAAFHYGKFLTALKCDWENDPNSKETPMRISKAFVNDLWKGRYTDMSPITSFPSDGYDGCVTQCNIPLISMCSHHHQTIIGKVHISYVPGDGGEVIGLSKMNRIVEKFGRRGAIQEQLTMGIHHAINKVCIDNIGVAVQIIATHNCVQCRGVGHIGANMVTTKLSGVFKDKPEVRNEFFKAIELS